MRRIARLLSVLVLAAASALAGVWPASASTAPVNCQVWAYPPVWSSGYMVAEGIVTCSPGGDLDIVVHLYRDGTRVSGTENSCWGNKTRCGATTASRNLSGDQEWCTVAVGYYDGIFLNTDVTCEATGY